MYCLASQASRKSFLNQTTYVLKNRLLQQSFLNRDSFLNRAFLNQELTVYICSTYKSIKSYSKITSNTRMYILFRHLFSTQAKIDQKIGNIPTLVNVLQHQTQLSCQGVCLIATMCIEKSKILIQMKDVKQLQYTLQG